MCKTKEREYRAKARRELGYRDAKIQSGKTINSAKVKASRRCSIKRQADKEIRKYL